MIHTRHRTAIAALCLAAITTLHASAEEHPPAARPGGHTATVMIQVLPTTAAPHAPLQTPNSELRTPNSELRTPNS